MHLGANFFLGDRPTILGGWVRMGAVGRGRGVWYTAKPTITGKMCLLDPKLYLSLFASQSPYTFCMGNISPNCGRRGGVGRSDMVPSESLPL